MSTRLGKTFFRNLGVNILVYVVVVFLLIGKLIAGGWTQFLQILAMPTVSVILVAGVVLVVISTLILHIRKLQLTGMIVGLVGVIAIVLFTVAPQEILHAAKYDVVGFGVGAIGVGVGFYSTGVAVESTGMIKSMANLEFYEKIAIVDEYLHAIDAKADIVADRIYHEIKGAWQLKKYVDPKIERELDNKINAMKGKILEGQQYGELVNRIQQLQDEDC